MPKSELNSKGGNTDISSIGDGTYSGGIKYLSDDLAKKVYLDRGLTRGEVYSDGIDWYEIGLHNANDTSKTRRLLMGDSRGIAWCDKDWGIIWAMQKTTDTSLQTNSKSVVGAINEVYNLKVRKATLTCYFTTSAIMYIGGYSWAARILQLIPNNNNTISFSNVILVRQDYTYLVAYKIQYDGTVVPLTGIEAPMYIDCIYIDYEPVIS